MLYGALTWASMLWCNRMTFLTLQSLEFWSHKTSLSRDYHCFPFLCPGHTNVNTCDLGLHLTVIFIINWSDDYFRDESINWSFPHSPTSSRRYLVLWGQQSKNVQFTLMYDKAKDHILTFQKLEPLNSWKSWNSFLFFDHQLIDQSATKHLRSGQRKTLRPLKAVLNWTYWTLLLNQAQLLNRKWVLYCISASVWVKRPPPREFDFP